jgi:hypothetical protein
MNSVLKSFFEICDINIPADYSALEESTDFTSSDWSADYLQTDVDIPAICKRVTQERETNSNRYAKSSNRLPQHLPTAASSDESIGKLWSVNNSRWNTKATRTTEVAKKISTIDTMPVTENKPVFESVPVVQAVTAVERSPSGVRRKASTCYDKTTVGKGPAATARSGLGGPGGKLKSDGKVGGEKSTAMTARSALGGPGGKPKSDSKVDDGKILAVTARSALEGPGGKPKSGGGSRHRRSERMTAIIFQ